MPPDPANFETLAASDTHTAAVTDWIARNRYLWFTLVGLLLAISFNGHWHIGPDSAGYRQLGHNLATSGRYFFRADVPGLDQYHNEQGTRYPGLPILLAGLEKIFGQRDLPPLLLMMAMAALTLALVYRLMLYRVPQWLAVCVVVGVGTNPRFIQYSNEILSDLPFLLGVAITLLGYEQVMSAATRRWLVIGVIDTFVGIVIAAAMRPTFLMLCAALVAACLWGMVRGKTATQQSPLPRSSVRVRSALLLGAMILATIVFASLIDIRAKHSGMLSGGYEDRMWMKLRNFDTKILPLLPGNVGELLENALPMAVMGFRSGWGLIPLGTHHLGFGTGFSLLILTAGVGLFRRSVLWSLFILVTIASLILAGPVPRYFLMILPLLLAGWGLFIQWLAERFTAVWASRWVMRLGLFLLLVINLVASFDFDLMQRGYGKLVDARHHWAGLHHVGFLQAFDFGHWVGYDKLAAMLRKSTEPDAKIIGPDANVLTYLSDRQVYPPILGRKTRLAGKHFELVLFPENPNWHELDGDYPPLLKQFLRVLHAQQGAHVAGPTTRLNLAKIVHRPPHRLSKAARLEHARKMAVRNRAKALKAAHP